MRSWLRKVRGIFGTGLIWGLPGAAVGAIGGAVASVFGGAPLLGAIATGTTIVGGTFFLLGTAFATAFTLAEGRRTFDELSPWRAAIWGGLAGGAAPVLALLIFEPESAALLSDPRLLGALLAAIASYGGLSAALAAGTVGLAKQAPAEALEAATDPHALLEAAREG